MHKQIAGIPFDDFLNVTLTFVFAFCQATGWRTFGSKNAFGEEINDICMIADLKPSWLTQEGWLHLVWADYA